MAMTRKHYSEVASILKAQLGGAQYLPESGPAVRMAVKLIANELADVFKIDNPRFRYDRFYEAVGLDEFGNLR